MKSRSPALLLVAISAALSCLHATAGCGGGPKLVAVMGSAELAGIARVNIKQIDGSDLTLALHNDSDQPILVDRDAIFLVGPHGQRRRLPGGEEAKTSVRPGGALQIRLSFDLSDLRDGNHVQVILADALTVNGKRVAMPALRLRIPPEPPE
jgi:hypothetical protein